MYVRACARCAIERLEMPELSAVTSFPIFRCADDVRAVRKRRRRGGVQAIVSRRGYREEMNGLP